MAERICPVCGRGILTRCGRKGPWEKYVLPLFGVFPWRCGRCRTRLRLSDRGANFKRLTRSAESDSDAVLAGAKHSSTAEAEPSTDTVQ